MKTAFPQPTEPPWQMAIEVWCIMAFAAVLCAFMLLRPGRRPRIWDGIAWVLCAVALSALTILVLPQHVEIQQRENENAWVVWTFIGAIWAATGIRLFWYEGRWASAKWLGLSSLLLLPFLVPPVGQAREAARFVQCRINLKKIGQAMTCYQRVNQSLPAQQAGDPPHSWRVDLLPFLDQKATYESYRLDYAWDSPPNELAARLPVPQYICPSNPRDRDEQGRSRTCYALLFGSHAAWTPSGPRQLKNIPHGASQTAIVVEACGQNIVWTEPRDINVNQTPIGINLSGEDSFQSPGIISTYHTRGANVLMTDGSVRRISLNTDPQVLKALISADKE